MVLTVFFDGFGDGVQNILTIVRVDFAAKCLKDAGKGAWREPVNVFEPWRPLHPICSQRVLSRSHAAGFKGDTQLLCCCLRV
jgi:hypothetical protein